MADFTALKTAIQNAIKQNGNEEITGNLLQDVLLAIVTTLGDGSINELITALGSEATTRGNADTTLQQNINAEAQARQLADSTLQGGINTAMQAINAINNAVTNGCVYAGIATPSSTPASGKVFYLALTAGTYTNYGGLEVPQGINILKNNGSTWSLDAFVGIDDTPTPSSNNLVKSSGVFNDILTNGSAFDLTAYNNGTTYADLNAALTALNALPAAYKKGGMSMKFVRTSDNKYVQYRLMSDSFNTTVANWQGVDDEPTAGSDNLVTGNGINIGDNKSFLWSFEDNQLDSVETGGVTQKTFTAAPVGNHRLGIVLPANTTNKVRLVYRCTQIPQSNIAMYWQSQVDGHNIVNSQWLVFQQINGSYYAIIDFVANNAPNENTSVFMWLPNGYALTDNYPITFEMLVAQIGVKKYTNKDIDNIADQIQTNITDYLSTATIIGASILDDGSVVWSGSGSAARQIEINKGINNYIKISLYWLFGFMNTGTYSHFWAFYSGTPSASTLISISTDIIDGRETARTGHFNQVNIDVPSNAKYLVYLSRDLNGFSAKAYTDSYKNDTFLESLSNINKPLAQISNKPASRTVLYVKKDGTGDFTGIQEAINSITDASISNQYEIRVCDDFTFTSTLDLWVFSSPSTKNTNYSPTTFVGAILTKDWVNIVGDNMRRTVSVLAPNDVAGSSLQNIHCLFLRGNCTVENMNFIIKNGRYAIHQEIDPPSNTSVNAHTTLRNVDAIHLGNSDNPQGSQWPSCYAQANGASDGLEVTFENVRWSPAFFMHANANYNTKNKYHFKYCSIMYPKDNSFDGVQLGGNIGLNGSGQNPDIEFVGCNFIFMIVGPGMMVGNTIQSNARDIRTMIPNFVGHSNRPFFINEVNYGYYCLSFRTNDNNKNVNVVGGTALADIFGETFMKYNGAEDAKGFICGTEYHGIYGQDYALTLAHRLGNCGNTSKTLIISLDGVNQTITFNENFVTQDGSDYTDSTQPYRDDAYIIDYITNQLTGITCGTSNFEDFNCNYVFGDNFEYGFNNSGKTIMHGTPMVRDYSVFNGWKVCPAGKKPQGIAAERIDINQSGNISLIDKNLFNHLHGNPLRANGYMVKVAENGVFQRTENESEAVMVFCHRYWKLYE